MNCHTHFNGSIYVLDVFAWLENYIVQCLSTPSRGISLKNFLFSLSPLRGMTNSAFSIPQRFKAPAWVIRLSNGAPAWVFGLYGVAPAWAFSLGDVSPARVVFLSTISPECHPWPLAT